jgi:Flp pilus assembly protein TadD
MPIPDARTRGGARKLTSLALLGAVLITTAFVYWAALSFPFVEWDDPLYLQRNDFVKLGLTWDNLRWAFTTNELANWHPLTWLSFMLDIEIGGLDARVAHATNVALHLLNTALLFWLLGRGTRRWFLAAVVAGLFALHPLRVESVAWVSERKGLLSTVFGLLAIGAYGAYARHGGAMRYAAIAALFACSLMAKPMLVTLPLLLVALDLWPLGRLERTPAAVTLRRIVLEKAPLLALSVVSAIVTWVVQRAGGSMRPGETLAWPERLAHATVAPVWYLAKAIAPLGLAPLYTHPYLPGGTPWAAWQVAGAAVLLVALSLAAWRARREHPYVLAGWAWYLVSLLPVIGIVQVGFQAYADRYTYVPLLGPLVAVVWLVADIVQRRSSQLRLARAGAMLAALAAIAALASMTITQIEVWRSSIAVFERVLALSPEDPTAHLKLGNVYKAAGDRERAYAHFAEAVRVHPRWFKARMNLGHALLERGELERAIPQFQAAAEDPRSQGKAHRYLGFTYWELGRAAEAEAALREAVRLDPADSPAWNGLGVVLEAQGRLDEALAAFEEASRVDPRAPAPQANVERLRSP